MLARQRKSFINKDPSGIVSRRRRQFRPMLGCLASKQFLEIPPGLR